MTTRPAVSTSVLAFVVVVVIVAGAIGVIVFAFQPGTGTTSYPVIRTLATVCTPAITITSTGGSSNSTQTITLCHIEVSIGSYCGPFGCDISTTTVKSGQTP